MPGRTRRVRVVAAAVAVAGGLLATLPAAPAAAATPNCNIAMVHTNSAGRQLFIAGWDGTFTPDCLMRLGNVGNDVQTLQLTLNHCYGENLEADRIFGQLTRNALIRAQREVGVAADGVYGPQTRRAMRHRPVGGGACITSL
jgi:murein L,D-transpeptidase YcbB/YkuD